jgi:hypothetical protein
MAKQIYHGVINTNYVAGFKKFPQRFFKTYTEASLEALRKNSAFNEKKYVVKRFIFETKDAIHYDIYEHKYKRITK